MKKGLLALAVASFIFLDDTPKKENLFEKIAKDNCFRIENYQEYLIKACDDRLNDIVYLYYDLNKNGKPDLIAITKVLKRGISECDIRSYAPVVRIDETEDDLYDIYYLDQDLDGMFDFVHLNPQKRKIPKDKEGVFV